jgi:hypothetical protein
VSKSKLIRIGVVATSLAFALAGTFVFGPAGGARAAQTETQFISIDATTCIQATGGTLTRSTNAIASSSTSAWTIRCPIDFIDSTSGAATLTGMAGFAKATSDLTTSVAVTVFRRSPTADTSRTSVTTCNIAANNGVPTTCSTSLSHSIVDNTDSYYVEFSVPTGQGSYWNVSGARLTYTWVNGP